MTGKWNRSTEPLWGDTERVSRTTWIETFLNNTSSSTNPINISLEPNPSLRGQTPVTN